MAAAKELNKSQVNALGLEALLLAAITDEAADASNPGRPLQRGEEAIDPRCKVQAVCVSAQAAGGHGPRRVANLAVGGRRAVAPKAEQARQPVALSARSLQQHGHEHSLAPLRAGNLCWIPRSPPIIARTTCAGRSGTSAAASSRALKGGLALQAARAGHHHHHLTQTRARRRRAGGRREAWRWAAAISQVVAPPTNPVVGR